MPSSLDVCTSLDVEAPQLPHGKLPDTVYVSFSAEIIPITTETLLATMGNLVNARVKRVHLLLSTPGGSVMHGMNLYNVLRGMPIELTTHNVGNVDSIGNAIFLAGERRYACAHSTFMFHGVGFEPPGQTMIRFEEKNLNEFLGSIRSDHRRIGSIIAERAKLGQEAVEGLFRDAQTKDATWAVSAGIVHEIRAVDIPPGGPVFPLVFKR